jgi:hypothetical protein
LRARRRGEASKPRTRPRKYRAPTVARVRTSRREPVAYALTTIEFWSLWVIKWFSVVLFSGFALGGIVWSVAAEYRALVVPRGDVVAKASVVDLATYQGSAAYLLRYTVDGHVEEQWTYDVSAGTRAGDHIAVLVNTDDLSDVSDRRRRGSFWVPLIVAPGSAVIGWYSIYVARTRTEEVPWVLPGAWIWQIKLLSR